MMTLIQIWYEYSFVEHRSNLTSNTGNLGWTERQGQSKDVVLRQKMACHWSGFLDHFHDTHCKLNDRACIDSDWTRFARHFDVSAIFDLLNLLVSFCRRAAVHRTSV